MIKRSKCYLCGNTVFNLLHSGVRGDSEASVVKCHNCGLIQLDRIIENIDDFYQNSGMRGFDPVAKLINEEMAVSFDDDNRRFNLIKNMIENKKYMDFGCGHGGVLLRARRKTKELFAVEPEDNMRNNIVEEVVSYSSITEAKQELHEKMDVITLFHVLEHLEDPIDILCQLKELLSDNGRIIIEVPNADDALLSVYKNKQYADFSYWICHLYYFNNDSLRRIVKKAGFELTFIQQIQRYPLSNHLYWLVNGNPGGHDKWGFLSDEQLDEAYGKRLAGLGIADTIVAELRME